MAPDVFFFPLLLISCMVLAWILKKRSSFCLPLLEFFLELDFGTAKVKVHADKMYFDF